MNLYDILEVSPSASKEVITSAYRTLARRYHPDANQGENTKHFEEKMKQLNMAYEILSDEYKRAEYNLNLKRQSSPRPEPQVNPRPAPKPGPQNPRPQTAYQRTDSTPSAKPHRKREIPWGWVFVVALILICVVMQSFEDSATEAFDQPVISTPTSGLMVMYTKGLDRSPLEIKTPVGETDYFIKLVRPGNSSPAMTIFVNGGDTVNVDVPYGTYEMRYAAGTTWYGDKYLFGPDTQYSAMDDTFDFNEQGGWTVELIPQTDGNLTETTLDASSF